MTQKYYLYTRINIVSKLYEYFNMFLRFSPHPKQPVKPIKRKQIINNPYNWFDYPCKYIQINIILFQEHQPSKPAYAICESWKRLNQPSRISSKMDIERCLIATIEYSVLLSLPRGGIRRRLVLISMPPGTPSKIA